jgi:hypothetical protein
MFVQQVREKAIPLFWVKHQAADKMIEGEDGHGLSHEDILRLFQ